MASGSVIVWESAVRGAQPWQALDRSCNGWRLCRLLLQLVLLRGDQSNVPRGCCRGLLGLPGQFSSSQSRSSQEPAASLARIPDLCTDHIFIIPSSRTEKCRTTPHTYTHTHTWEYTPLYSHSEATQSILGLRVLGSNPRRPPFTQAGEKTNPNAEGALDSILTLELPFQLTSESQPRGSDSP